MIVDQDIQQSRGQFPRDNPVLKTQYIRRLIPGTPEYTAWQEYLSADTGDFAAQVQRERVEQLMPRFIESYLRAMLDRPRR